jgi:hypothetical protein
VGIFSKLSRGALIGSLAAASALAGAPAFAQVDEDKTGAWYMYFWNIPAGERRFGFQGDIQHRNWDTGGDLEQLLIRGGITWTPENSRAMYTLGVGHVTSGEFGPSGEESREKRIYQESLFSHQAGRNFFMTHRFRFEQRWVDNQDLRLRARYFFALNVPFNQDSLAAGAHYFAFYNELFLNLNQDIGQGRRVDTFDRNRLYLGYGYSLRDDLRLQFGYMNQRTDDIDKGQLQFSIFHTI